MSAPAAGNIGPRQRRRRLALGAVGFAAAALAGWALVATGASRWWRLALALPIWAGALGLLQAHAAT